MAEYIITFGYGKGNEKEAYSNKTLEGRTSWSQSSAGNASKIDSLTHMDVPFTLHDKIGNTIYEGFMSRDSVGVVGSDGILRDDALLDMAAIDPDVVEIRVAGLPQHRNASLPVKTAFIQGYSPVGRFSVPETARLPIL